MRESLPQLEQMTNFFTYLSFLRLYVLNQKNEAHSVCLNKLFTYPLPPHVQAYLSTRAMLCNWAEGGNCGHDDRHAGGFSRREGGVGGKALSDYEIFFPAGLSEIVGCDSPNLFFTAKQKKKT